MNNQRIEFSPISVSGCFWSGSGAIVGLLSEHPDCNIIPNEFTLFSYGQFFNEVIEALLQKKKIDSAYQYNLRRFEEFNKSEPPIILSALRYFCAKIGVFPRWLFAFKLGMSNVLGERYLSACNELLNELNSPVSINNIDLDKICLLINNVLFEASKGSDNINEDPIVTVFDQMISPPYASSAWAALPNLKLICVDRDWRDQYVEVRDQISRMIRVKQVLGVKFWGLDIYSDDWKKPVDIFIRLRNKIDHVKNQHLQNADKRLIWINFEDIIYDTKKTAQTVFDFLNLDVSKWIPNRYLIPQNSILNIGKWRNSRYVKEIEIIKEQIEIH